MRKGQSTIVGFVLITAIAIVIVSVTLLWAAPLLENSRNQLEVQRLEQKFLDLHETIEKVASSQGKLSLQFITSKGVISLDSNSNSIIFQSQLGLDAIPCKNLFGEIDCSEILFGNAEGGIIGVNKSAYLLEQEAVDFELHYTYLTDSAESRCYRIKLQPGRQTTAGPGRHTAFLTWLQENVTTSGLPAGCGDAANLTEQLVEFHIE
jgi:hypothetical protein